MIHFDLLEEIKKRRQNGSFIYPDYGNLSIAEIPSTVLSFFGIESGRNRLPFPGVADNATRGMDSRKQKLIFFFVDGFGFDHFVDYEKELPFFHRLAQQAEVYPLTSVFPSTTSAALTALHTNKTPQEHGLPEWTVYLEELGRISYGTLRENQGPPKMLYNGDTLYDTLLAQGINSYVFSYDSYFPSSYSEVTQHGSVPMLYKNEEDLFPQLLQKLEEVDGPAYFFVYWGDVDSVEHTYGPRSTEHLDALRKISTALEERFLKKLSPRVAAETMFVLGSDHGQAGIRNEEIIYLNRYMDLETSYSKTASQKNIFPTGAPHDVFLHIANGKVDPMITYLRKELAGKADVISTKEALARGLFGLNQPIDRFLKRIGDIIILPYEGYHVWYQHTPNYVWGQLGIHGGLSRAEMLVPFAVVPLSKLKG